MKGRVIDHIGFEVKNLEADGSNWTFPSREPKNGIATAFSTDPAGVYIELTDGLDKF